MANYIEIADPNFNKKSTSAYDLLVNINTDRVSFAIFDSQQKILLLRQYELYEGNGEELKDRFKTLYFEDNLLSLPYRAVKVSIEAPVFAFIPQRLYKAENDADYLADLTEIPDVLTTISQPLPRVAIHQVFAVQEQLLNSLRSYFSQCQVFHSLAPLINGYYLLSENKAGAQVFANVHQHRLQLVLFDNKNLIFVNQFEFFSKQDFIYYVLLIFEQFKLDPETTPIVISGYILEKSELHNILFQYIRHISFVPAPSFFQFGEAFQETHLHFYFELFCLQLCE